MIRHLIFRIDKDDSIGGGDITDNCLLCQTYPGLSWLYALGNHMGPDIFRFLKVVINVLCLSSVALLCVFRFAVFLTLETVFLTFAIN